VYVGICPVLPCLTFRSVVTLPAKYPYLRKDPQKPTDGEELGKKEMQTNKASDFLLLKLTQ